MDDIEQEVEKIKDDVQQKNLQSEPYKRQQTEAAHAGEEIAKVETYENEV